MLVCRATSARQAARAAGYSRSSAGSRSAAVGGVGDTCVDGAAAEGAAAGDGVDGAAAGGVWSASLSVRVHAVEAHATAAANRRMGAMQFANAMTQLLWRLGETQPVHGGRAACAAAANCTQPVVIIACRRGHRVMPTPTPQLQSQRSCSNRSPRNSTAARTAGSWPRRCGIIRAQRAAASFSTRVAGIAAASELQRCRGGVRLRLDRARSMDRRAIHSTSSSHDEYRQ